MSTKPIFDKVNLSGDVKRNIFDVSKKYLLRSQRYLLCQHSTKDGEPASAGCESGPMTSRPLHQNLQNPQNLQCFSPQITKIFQIPLSISWFFFLWAENPNLLTSFSGCSNTFFQGLSIPIKYGKLSLGHNLVGTFESVAAGNTVLSVFTTAASLTTLTTN